MLSQIIAHFFRRHRIKLAKIADGYYLDLITIFSDDSLLIHRYDPEITAIQFSSTFYHTVNLSL